MTRIGEGEAKVFVEDWLEQVTHLQDGEAAVLLGRTWTSYRAMATKVLEQCPGRKRGRQAKKEGQWYELHDADVQRLKREASKTLLELRQARSGGVPVDGLVGRYRTLKKQAKTLLKLKLKEKAQSVVQRIEQLKVDDPKEGWRALKDLTKAGARTVTLQSVLANDGTEFAGVEARSLVAEAFRQLGIHDKEDEQFDKSFEQLIKHQVACMARERIVQDELDHAITLAEVEKVVKATKKGKATGTDTIIGEWLKYGGRRMTMALWVMMNQAWLSETSPQEWAHGVVVPVYKEGDKRDPLNYRGITLLSVVGKAYAAVLNNRLAPWLEAQGALSDEQGGFKRGRGCPEQCFALSELLHLRKGERTYTCFIDIRKAFDRAWRDGIWSRLWKVGVKGGCGEFLGGCIDQYLVVLE